MSSLFRSSIPGIAAWLVLWWVRIYTIGLSSVSRERRAGQIHSDLWDHYTDRAEDGTNPALIGLAALARAARGAAADLVWRREQKGPVKAPAEDVGSKLERTIKVATMTVQ